jgi:TatD DNase family protein
MHQLIDTHAHLDEIENLALAIEKAKECGIISVIAVGVDYESNNRVLEISEQYKSLVFPALGCHPGNLSETMSEIERNLRFIQDNIEKAVAIGEIGLDYHKKVLKRTGKDTQKQVLREVLEIARRCGKPVSVHSRYSWQDCLTIVRQSQVTRAVFHWYSGPLSVLHDLLSDGYFISATPAVEYGAEHSQAIAQTPLDNLMLETDSPVIYRRSTGPSLPSQPADVVKVLEAVSKMKGIEPALLAERSTRNALKFFRLSEGGG